MRSLAANDHVVIDSIDHNNDGFQTLQLDFSPEPRIPWPAVFDEQLNSFPSPQLLKQLSKYSVDKNPRTAAGYPSPPPTPTTKVRADVPKKPRPELDYLHFSGTGIDADPYFCSGIIHALPPQRGIPGFQRITMMKVFPPHTSESELFTSGGSNSDSSNTSSGGFVAPSTIPDAVDESCWAYEGVVMPGGMIILGRWWSPADETMDRLGTGPFIFWNVEDD